MTIGLDEVEVERMENGREAAIRRGFLGGRGIGGSACLVCSYRNATRLVSSRNGAMRATGLVLYRTLANFCGAMAPLLRS